MSEKQPLIFPSLPKFGTTQILITALIIAAFLLGSLITKVQYLERSGSSAGTTNVPSSPQAAAPNQPQAPNPGQKQNVDSGRLPVLGNKNAKVAIVAFEDFRCPFCDRFTKETLSQLKKDYIDTGKATFAYRHYQFLGSASIVAGNAAECANEQGKFWEMHDYLYANQPPESDTSMYTTDKLTQIAGKLGINTNQFQSCLDSKKYDKNVSDDLAAGQKAGVSGTPTTFINGISIVGAVPYTQIKAEIDKALQ